MCDSESPKPTTPESLSGDDLASLNQQLEEHVKVSLERLAEARSDVPGVVSYGASNYPHDPDFWVADWREILPHDDPRRVSGPPLIKPGTVAAYRSMQRAHHAARLAFGLSRQDSEHL